MRSTGNGSVKEFKSSRQSSRSRSRRLLGADSSSNLLGSTKGALLAEDDGGKPDTMLLKIRIMHIVWRPFIVSLFVLLNIMYAFR